MQQTVSCLREAWKGRLVSSQSWKIPTAQLLSLSPQSTQGPLFLCAQPHSKPREVESWFGRKRCWRFAQQAPVTPHPRRRQHHGSGQGVHCLAQVLPPTHGSDLAQVTSWSCSSTTFAKMSNDDMSRGHPCCLSLNCRNRNENVLFQKSWLKPASAAGASQWWEQRTRALGLHEQDKNPRETKTARPHVERLASRAVLASSVSSSPSSHQKGWHGLMKTYPPVI